MSLFSKKESDQPRQGSEEAPTTYKSKRGYGIAETVLLMRSIPVEQNVELVVRVIRSTLESLNVHLPDIIEDASAKEKSLEIRLDTVHGEIIELDKQIDTRKKEIDRLRAELSETTTVKERLMLAQKLGVLPTSPLSGPVATATAPPSSPRPSPPPRTAAMTTPTPPPLKMPARNGSDVDDPTNPTNPTK
jgi:hypothetical protein